jgi:hypothetical protein
MGGIQPEPSRCGTSAAVKFPFRSGIVLPFLAAGPDDLPIVMPGLIVRFRFPVTFKIVSVKGMVSNRHRFVDSVVYDFEWASVVRGHVFSKRV